MARTFTAERVVMLFVGGIGVVLVTMLAALALTVANEGTLPLTVVAALMLALLLLGRRTRPSADGSA
jgi:hypothetical protein